MGLNDTWQDEPGDTVSWPRAAAVGVVMLIVAMVGAGHGTPTTAPTTTTTTTTTRVVRPDGQSWGASTRPSGGQWQ
jgi:hypothetical protein